MHSRSHMRRRPIPRPTQTPLTPLHLNLITLMNLHLLLTRRETRPIRRRAPGMFFAVRGACVADSGPGAPVEERSEGGETADYDAEGEFDAFPDYEVH